MILKLFLILLTVVAVLTFIVAIAMYLAFSHRCEGNPNLKYFTHKDFADLSAHPVEFPSNKGQLLRGAVYTYEAAVPPAGLVIFAHGGGGGHLSYMTEIYTIARAGYAVLAYDNTGTMGSQGKSLVGFYQAVRDLEAAVQYAVSSPSLSAFKPALVGHSWGGYAVCCASAHVKDQISAVVALSAPNDVARLALDPIRAKLGAAVLLYPAFAMASVLVNGIRSRKTVSNVLLAAGDLPILLIQGDADPTVTMKNSPVSNEKLTARDNVKTVICKDRGHNVYQTAESEKYLMKVFSMISAAEKKYKSSGTIPAQEKAKLYDIDYALITEEDENIMNTILSFIGKAMY